MCSNAGLSTLFAYSSRRTLERPCGASNIAVDFYEVLLWSHRDGTRRAIRERHAIDRRSLILSISAAACQGLSVTALGQSEQTRSAQTSSAQTSSAQTWPSRSIVVTVPFPAGGSSDLSARLLAEELKAALGQPVVVENKPGAGGNLAAAAAARAKADGYTLFIGTKGRKPSARVSIGSFPTIPQPTLPRLR
jgi:hypothetical protein